MKIAYLINQYPKVSHSFVRREILALERDGISVARFAVRGWDAEIVDAEDEREREHTRYLLKSGVVPLIMASLRCLFQTPSGFFSACNKVWALSRKADRAWPYHIVYLAEACQLWLWLKAGGIQHLHAHFGTNATEVALLANTLGGPGFSFTVHGPEEFDRPELLKLREKVHHAEFVVAISSFGRSQLLRWADFSDWSKVTVVHCGLEATFYDVAQSPLPITPRLVCVGRICEQKGQLLLIEAMRLLSERNVKLELVLAGDGEMRDEVEALVERYNLGAFVRITGWISGEQVRNEILASRGLVLPSFAEGLPVVIMEAMALRRPVITTYVAGIPELVQDKINGSLIPAGSVVELAAAIERYLSLSDESVIEMGEAARVRVLARHDIDCEAAKLAELFRSVAS